MNKEEVKFVSWIVRGSQRREIFRVLENNMIPAQIYKEAVKYNPKITRNSVSDVLRVFKKKDIVRCINPEEAKGRLYCLTQRGKELKKKFKM